MIPIQLRLQFLLIVTFWKTSLERMYFGLMEVQKNDKKTIRGWAFFDWANSAYNLVISTAIFPPFFTAMAPEKINFLGMDILSSAMYSYSVSFAFLIVALLSPMLSGIADYSGRRMYFLKIFTFIGALSCAALFLFDGQDTVWYGLIFFMLGTIGFGGGLVFYNAYLPVIATEDQFDKVSAKGFAYGYFGSVLLLLFILAMMLYPDTFGIEDKTLAPRIGFILVGVWWLIFAYVSFSALPPDKNTKMELSFVSKGFHEVKGVFSQLLKNARIKRFLYSYFFFIAAVNTVIYLATVFAEVELKFDTQELIIVVLLLQLVASLGAIFFARVSDRIGNKKTLLIQISIWIVICIAAYLTSGKMMFYGVAAFVGLVLGGIQSLSRSTYSKMIKDNVDDLNSYFSFFDVLTRLAIVAGTFLFGIVNQMTGNIRYSVLSLAVLFIISLLILWNAKIEEA